MITVIADDITGAAEIAGAAWSHGLKVVLSTGFNQQNDDTDVLVIATDTRSGCEADAVNEMLCLARQIEHNGGILFKKTDSALRGHIVAELNALFKIKAYTRALLLPQNPSKDRAISNGTYFISGNPLAETAFKDDPEFPAKSSAVTEILGRSVNILTLDGSLPQNSKGIYVAEASTLDDVATQLNTTDKQTLLAGGADLFKALLEKSYPQSTLRTGEGKITPRGHSIIVCGSTQSEDITHRNFAKASMTYNAAIPDDVFAGAAADKWQASLPDIYIRNKSIALTIGNKENGGPQCALRLRKIMAEAVKRLVDANQPELLIIEGGATAYSIIKELGWNNLEIRTEYRPGIVGMTHGKTEIVMKPGSYPWGDIL